MHEGAALATAGALVVALDSAFRSGGRGRGESCAAGRQARRAEAGRAAVGKLRADPVRRRPARGTHAAAGRAKGQCARRRSRAGVHRGSRGRVDNATAGRVCGNRPRPRCAGGAGQRRWRCGRCAVLPARRRSRAWGRRWSDAGGDIAAVELDEQASLARDMFRRFAAEVVAPQAEDIHRRDLTVPESLLQPLREMGVFGLSIPERSAASAPDGREDTPMMVVVTEALSEASLAAAGSLITRPEILRAGAAGRRHRGAEAALAAAARRRRPAVRDRDHRAGLRLGRGEPRAQGHAGRRRLAARRRQDVVHVRRQGGRADGGRAHRPGSLGRASRAVAAAGGEAGVRRPRVRRTCRRAAASSTGRAIPTIGYRGMHSFDLCVRGFLRARMPTSSAAPPGWARASTSRWPAWWAGACRRRRARWA